MNKMLTLAFILLATLAIIPQQTHAQENLIKLNPLSLVIGTVNTSFEHKMNEKQSAQLGLGFVFIKIAGVSYSGVFLTPEYRFFLTSDIKDVPAGFYAAPFLRASFLGFKEGGDSITNFNSIGGGAVIGYQWVWSERFSLDIFAGPSISTTSNDDVDARFTGIGGRLGAAVGIAL